MPLKFAFIVGCLAIAGVSYFFCKSKKDWAWLCAGLLFTVGADYFLVLQNRHLPGVAVFCFAHVCYILRAMQPRSKVKATLAVAVLAAVILFTFINGSLLFLTGIYAGLFVTNIALNIKFCKINKPLVLTGLVLFMLCDINVALFNLPQHLNFPIFPWVFTLIWVFYLPSQLLLSVSAVAFPKLKE